MKVKHKTSGHVCDAEMYEDGTWAVTDEAGDVQDWSWEGFFGSWAPFSPSKGLQSLTMPSPPIGDLGPVTQGQLNRELAELIEGINAKTKTQGERANCHEKESEHLRKALAALKSAVWRLYTKQRKEAGPFVDLAVKYMDEAYHARWWLAAGALLPTRADLHQRQRDLQKEMSNMRMRGTYND